MMRARLIQTAVFCAATLWGGTSAAYTLLKLDNFDIVFGGSSGLCATDGTLGGSNPCEYAAVEMKRGPSSGELILRTATFGDFLNGSLVVDGTGSGTNPNTPLTTNALPWTSTSVDTYELYWKIGADPNDSAKAVEFLVEVTGINGGTTPPASGYRISMTASDSSFTNNTFPGNTLAPAPLPEAMEQLWIRLAAVNGQQSLVTITRILANGVLSNVPSGSAQIAAGGSGDPAGAPYFLLFDMDFSQPWYVEGTARFNMAGGTGAERPAINWKLTEEIGDFKPVPAPGTLLLVALGALAMPAVRQRPS